MSKVETAKKIIKNTLVNKGLYSHSTDKRLMILMYHGIDQATNTRFNQRFFSKSTFEKQIILFKKHFNILTHSDFINKNYSQNRLNILITFDDGYANNLHYALPVLEKYNVPAYFFITGVGSLDKKVLWADAIDIVSGYGKPGSKIIINDVAFYLNNNVFLNPESGIDVKKYIKNSKTPGYAEKEKLIDQALAIYDFTRDEKLNDYWQIMTDEQIRQTSKSKNITIGSHGFYHNNLGALSNGDAIDEVKLSKNYLENIVQDKITAIGFPDGSYTERLNDGLFAIGFTQQFVVDYKFSDKNKRSFTFDRFGLYPFQGNNNEILYKILN